MLKSWVYRVYWVSGVYGAYRVYRVSGLGSRGLGFMTLSMESSRDNYLSCAEFRDCLLRCISPLLACAG